MEKRPVSRTSESVSGLEQSRGATPQTDPREQVCSRCFQVDLVHCPTCTNFKFFSMSTCFEPVYLYRLCWSHFFSHLNSNFRNCSVLHVPSAAPSTGPKHQMHSPKALPNLTHLRGKGVIVHLRFICKTPSNSWGCRLLTVSFCRSKWMILDDLLYPNPKKTETPQRNLSVIRGLITIKPHYRSPFIRLYWTLVAAATFVFFSIFSAPRSPSDTPKWPSCWSSGMWMYLETDSKGKISGHPVAVAWNLARFRLVVKITAGVKPVNSMVSPPKIT